MKRIYIGAFALFFSLSVAAQGSLVSDYPVLESAETVSSTISPGLFRHLMATYPNITDTEVQEKYQELERIVYKLNRKLKKAKSMEQFLNYFFYYVHRTQLKNYRLYATLGDLMTSKDYDCVSGTALYALLLDALHINFSVREMTYHMYLEIPLEDGVAFIESTDPLSGLVIGEEAILARKATYQAEEIDQKVYDQPIRARVGMPELIGLSYFNAAVYRYNQQQLTPARHYLRQAIRWYPAERMYALQALIESVATR